MILDTNCGTIYVLDPFCDFAVVGVSGNAHVRVLAGVFLIIRYAQALMVHLESLEGIIEIDLIESCLFFEMNAIKKIAAIFNSKFGFDVEIKWNSLTNTHHLHSATDTEKRELSI